MPAWWGKKSHKNNKDQQTIKNKEKAKSFDDTLIIPRTQTRDFFIFNCSPSTSSPASVVSSSSLDFNFDKKRGHPLPRPSVSSAPSLIQDHNGIVASGSGSMCGSSVSSSASSDDPNPDFGFSNIYRGHTPTAGSPKARSPKAVSPKARSPGPGSRGPTVTTSLLHPRLSGMSLLESPTSKQEDDGRSPCHPLPLPPGSPTKSSTSPTSARSFAAVENSQFLRPKWKKGKLLGRGTFGHVYLGFNSEGGQMCAIKEVTLLSDDQNSKECLKQLNQEINLLGQLSHPNIVLYHGSDMGEEALSVYLEFVSGGSIHKLLQEYGAFKEPVIQNYTRQILLGLSYLHARNTVHRDIKGANILVGPNGEIKLADFGMAKHVCEMEPGFLRECDALVRNLQGRLEIVAVSVHFEGDTHVDDDHEDFPSNQSSGSVEEINEKMLKQVISAKQPSENMATGSGNAEGEVKQSKCSTCNAFVGDSKQYREHFKSEWHKHNLRRKTRQLPPITAEECLVDLDLNDMKSDLKEYSF